MHAHATRPRIALKLSHHCDLALLDTFLTQRGFRAKAQYEIDSITETTLYANVVTLYYTLELITYDF